MGSPSPNASAGNVLHKEAAVPFVPDCLRGFNAFVTGGGSGIGLAISKLLHSLGARVALAGRRGAVLAEAKRQLESEWKNGRHSCPEVLTLIADVRKPEMVQEAVNEISRCWGGKLHLLVNCAAGNFLATCNEVFGSAEGGQATDLSVNAFRTVVEIDLVGSFQVSKATLPLLRAAVADGEPAAIVNISAVHEDLAGSGLQTHAASAKAGLDAMTRALAVEWGPLGVRVNGVAPGPVRDTEGFARLSAFQPAEAAKKTAALLPLRRAGSPAEIAEAVVFLFLHRWITGETLRVDGGEAVARPPFVSPELYAMLRSARTTERSKL